ncbi:hypothetical protein SDC9_208770 [bioreactor metagenome]|uniref:Uncharacterized protein n=1 Tax=bioreactor metagenome TaxID=1076179 RepID=A0A645JC63_9ZZZZ
MLELFDLNRPSFIYSPPSLNGSMLATSARKSARRFSLRNAVSAPPRMMSQSSAERMAIMPWARRAVYSSQAALNLRLPLSRPEKNSSSVMPRLSLITEVEQYASRQPRCPQRHRLPPGTMHICPNSPLRELSPV